MTIKRTLLLFSTIAAIAISPMLPCRATPDTISARYNDEKEQNAQQFTSTISPQVPQSVVFANEKIDLGTQDRRERMDREMLSFCYSHINTMLQIKRANRLFPIVEPILKAQGIPEDFKYLMIIECNGDIEARSNAGAAGPWQFLEKTGRQYGLEVNGEVDERYNIEKATVAACKYLKESYEEFGDWLTVAASYNTGRSNVSKRITAQKEKKAIDLVLLPETSRYIFRLLAVKTVFSNPKAYGFILKESDLYPAVPIARTITISGPVSSWAAIAKKHGVTYLQLHEANPWIRSASMTNKSNRRYKVKIPDSKGLRYDPKKTKAHDRRWIAE
ncbi:MAG: lytic transglycosylase domain-containing protein [Bacteroidaceae bacterium]|nr:lytic transglycosylase domain-containing protein [Bacteroidaceae bacterium]